MKRKLLTITAAAGILISGLPGVASANGDTYTVKSGDTLWKISQANGTTIHQLVDWNDLNTSEIRVGQSLFITNPGSTSNIYTVKSGDTLWKIANAHGTTISALKSMNSLTSDEINPGQTLIIKESNASVSPSTYTVKSGDTLWKIANRYGLTVAQLKSYNGLTSESIYANQVLKLTSNGSVKVSQASDSTVNALIAEAKKYIGVPYQWGGSTPAAFDCSGYLNYVYNNVGISIPRTVETIWNATKVVSSPSVGDLVFYNTSGSGASHAGIYLGNNQFIHAGTSTGVTISDMNSSYWKSRYLGARTPF